MKKFTFILTLFVAAGILYSQQFNNRFNLEGGGSPYFVTSADMNGDNIEDIIFTNFNDSSFSIYINKTDPSESKPNFTKRFDFATKGGPIKLGVADFNNDGMNDIVIAQYTENEISVWRNTTSVYDTNLTFVQDNSVQSVTMPGGIDVGDFDNDGLIDVICSNFTERQLTILKNSSTLGGNIVLAPFKITKVFDGPSTVGLIDINQDNLLDIITSNIKDRSITYIYHSEITPNDGIEYGVPTSISNNRKQIYDFGIGDVDGDGDNDIVGVSLDSTMTVWVRENEVYNQSYTLNLNASMNDLLLEDIDGDGKKDFLVTSSKDSSIYVLINSSIASTKQYSWSKQYHIFTGKMPTSITSSDINHDGRKDIIVANSESNTITIVYNDYILLNDGLQFSRKDFDSKGKIMDISVADFNRDGLPDVATGEWDSSGVTIFVNQSPRAGTTSDFNLKYFLPVKSNGSDVEVTDINMDGAPDIAVCNWGDDISIYLNKTAPRESNLLFSQRFDFSTGQYVGPNGAAFGDLNSDGKPDLVVTNQFPDINSESTIAVLINKSILGDTVAQFTQYKRLLSGDGPWEVKIEDMNFDKKPDIVVANFTSGSVSIWENNTAAGDTTFSFANRYDFSTGSGTAGLDIGDLNQDGKPDIAVANQNADSIAILINKSQPASTPAFETPRMFAAEYGPFFIRIADVDNDSKPELVVANTSFRNAFSIFANGWYPGEFVPYFGDMVNYEVDSLPVALEVADFNVDGKPDVVTANQNGKSISVNINTSTLTSVRELSIDKSIPEKFELLQNYPNPFNPTTKISFKLKSDVVARLDIYNVLGQRVLAALNNNLKAGSYSVNVDLSGFSSGIYIARLKAGNYTGTVKMMLLK
ncbi:MAG: T9SS C-terminal target domain-containing protein [Ignavibacteria bacterium]|nr:MAG: T9SS C-terminal target domain-containing protein [Ignavibacteria bacterium]